MVHQPTNIFLIIYYPSLVCQYNININTYNININRIYSYIYLGNSGVSLGDPGGPGVCFDRFVCCGVVLVPYIHISISIFYNNIVQ